ncbi:phosphoribosylglycinamide formyltransferase [Cytophagales bacterium WSM2-2]|nr:phosphoribosylglycinamide formyltransferase [Cytophagales bacterium WSM2-2]
MKKIRFAIFASGNGSNAEAIMKYFQNHPKIEVAALLCNNPGAFVIERAQKFHIPIRVFEKSQFQDSDEVIHWLSENRISHIVLAGFLLLIQQKLVDAFPDRIINIHPSLLPKFGGRGMYGMNVHKAVAASSEKETGITIHRVNAHYDEGEIIAQFKCEISPGESAESIANKVQKLEHEHYPGIIETWVFG